MGFRLLLMQFDKGEFAGAVDGNEETEFALLSADLGNIDVEVAERVAFELASLGFIAVDIRQAGDAMASKAAMQ